MEFKKVGVLGCGLMGAGIAQTAAMAGFETIVREVSDDLLAKGFAGIEKSLSKFAEKGTITADQQKEIRDRLKRHDVVRRPGGLRHHHRSHHRKSRDQTRNLSAAGRALQTGNDLCLEHFLAFDHANDVGDVDRAAAALYRHALLQSRAAHEAGRSHSHDSDRRKRFTKMPSRLQPASAKCRCAPRSHGIHREPVCWCRTCWMRFARWKKASASIVDIDNAMKLGCGYPMGPLTLGDFVGLDTTYYIAEIMFNEFREKRFASPPLLKRMVMAGLYGRKSGRGFYDYTKDPKNPTPMNLV